MMSRQDTHVTPEWWSFLRSGCKGENAMENKICHRRQAGFFFDSRVKIFWFPTLWDILCVLLHQTRISDFKEEVKPKIEDKWHWSCIKWYFIHGSATVWTESQRWKEGKFVLLLTPFKLGTLPESVVHSEPWLCATTRCVHCGFS
jgi:hypothetical protein